MLLIGTVRGVVVLVVKRLLVRTEVDVFLDGEAVRDRVNVVAGTDCVDVLIIAASSSTQFVIGPFHCPDAVHEIKAGPSSLKPRAHWISAREP
jgi:hypothetical protein